MTRLPRWTLEAVSIVGLYFAGELARGFVHGGRASSEAHAADIIRLERRLHIFDEEAVQHAARHVGGLPTCLSYAYVSLHLAVTVFVLAWVYRRRRNVYARLRNVLALSTGLAVAVYAVFPTAPPRLAGVGITDTVSAATSVDLNSTFASSLYNPYAAVPSMHIGFSLVVGGAIALFAQRTVWRIVGALYPVFVLFVIVATGNHFFVDAIAGAAVAAVATAAVALISRRPLHEFG
jgi:hypothetical protein